MKLFDVPVKDANGHEYILFDLLTQKDLGDLSGVTRQTISNILKKKSVCTF
jgi:DNA-binding MarR family transcriptional regulator